MAAEMVGLREDWQRGAKEGVEDSKVGVRRCCRQPKAAEPGVGPKGLGLGLLVGGVSALLGGNVKEKYLVARTRA